MDERPRRENMMERRLRKARGEEVPDDLDPFDVYDDDDEPRGLGPGPRRGGGGGYGYGRGGGGGGCAQATLYLVLGGIVALLLGGLILNQTLGGLGRIFEPPDIATIIATPTPRIITSAAVIQRVQELSRLETASYTVQTVIDVRQPSNIPFFGDYLAGDALLLIAHGTVIAGVDLRGLPADAVTVAPDGRSVTLRLPPAQIFSATLDSQKTRVYSRERGLFAPENKDLETVARQRAEEEILRAACEDGVLSKASTQAEAALRQFLGLIDEVQVVVVVSPPGACVPPATTP